MSRATAKCNVDGWIMHLISTSTGIKWGNSGQSHLLNKNGDLSFLFYFSKQCLEKIIQEKFQKNSSVTFISEESPQALFPYDNRWSQWIALNNWRIAKTNEPCGGCNLQVAGCRCRLQVAIIIIIIIIAINYCRNHGKLKGIYKHLCTYESTYRLWMSFAQR